jgi:hypothetical protein
MCEASADELQVAFVLLFLTALTSSLACAVALWSILKRGHVQAQFSNLFTVNILLSDFLQMGGAALFTLTWVLSPLNDFGCDAASWGKCVVSDRKTREQ